MRTICVKNIIVLIAVAVTQTLSTLEEQRADNFEDQRTLVDKEENIASFLNKDLPNEAKSNNTNTSIHILNAEIQAPIPEKIIFVPAKFEYKKVGIDLSRSESILFQVLMCQDAHVALTILEENYESYMYEIVIGGYGNTKSTIRKKSLGPELSVTETVGYLSCQEPRWFWISWKDGIINVGKGENVGQLNFLTFLDSSPTHIKYMSVSARYHAGTFVIYGIRSSCNSRILIQQMDGNKISAHYSDNYKIGFRNIANDFWLGNNNLHALTTNRKYKVRFELQSKSNGLWYVAEYNTFVVGDEASSFQLTIDGYSGNATDAMFYHNGMKFQAYHYVYEKCATQYSGWWFNSCSIACVTCEASTGNFMWAGIPGSQLMASRMWLVCR